MKKNEIYEGVVTDIGCNGEGILKKDEYIIFIPFTLPGEKVQYKVLKVQKNIVYGKLLDVLTPAEFRERPLCEVYTKCGGCQYQHLRYYKQLKQKTITVKNCLRKIANVDVEVPLTIKSDLSYGYRNKLQLPIRRVDNFVKIGFFAQNSHRVVEINTCPLHGEWSTQIILALKEYINKCNVFCYSDEDKKGSLRHVVVREVNGKFLITLVTKENLSNLNVFVEALKKYFKNFSLFVNYNYSDTNVILGKEFSLIYGEEFIEDTIYGIRYKVGPESFIQVNNNVKTKLYNEIKKLVGDEQTTVIDAYSGVGLLTAIIAKNAKKAIGVEIVKEAVDCAEKLAKENGLSDKMKSICGDCKEILPDIIKNLNDKFTIILDPPRKGVDKELLEVIKQGKPEKIIYCSCSPQTLARDINILLEGSSYKITYFQPYDMFPQTKQIETLCVLTYTD